MSSKTKTTATKEEDTPALVPKLRFPEFREAEGWKEKPLKAAAEINPANGGLPESFVYIDLESVDAGELKAKERISRVGAPSRAQRLVERGDIIYQVVRPYQRNNLLCEFDDDENYVASTGYAQLRAKGSNRFLYQSIHTDSFVGRVIAKCTGSNYPAINSSDLAEIHLPIPPTLPEQQKIAECLSSVDELMAAQARKVDALKTHKKGLMQQLFPREGETQPRLRFPEFQNAGDWVEDKLIDIATFRRGSFPQPYGLPEWYDEDSGMPFVQVFDVGDNFRLKDKTKSKISKLGAEKSVFIAKGTLIVTLQGSIGRVAITHYDAYIDRTLLIFETFLKPIEKVFFARLIQNLFDIEKEIAPGGIIKTITKEALSDFKVKLPTIEEQQRIADCLTSLDDLITAETQTLDALKTHKKGLMQQLFPSPEEVQA